MEKTIKILLIALVILTGCKVTRKVTESTVARSSEQTELTQQVKTQDVVNVQNDVNSELETTTVRTTKKYYPPTASSSAPLESSGNGGAVNHSTGSGTGGIDTGNGSPKTGALMEETTETTTTNKKDTDRSKVEATSEKQENKEEVKSQKSKVESDKTEVKKTGVATWKVIGGLVALLLVVYFLVKKNVIRIPFLTKIANLIDGFFGVSKGKTA